MPPKKKQEEIDIATLPPCKSVNAIILCKGKKDRAERLIEMVKKEADRSLIVVHKQEVLDHAKDKNIYVDPTTLNDKQKKDIKFMESINTQLTAQVVAKATQSLLGTLTIKARIEKKNRLDKGDNGKGIPYDLIYLFKDFPESKDQFEELAKVSQNIGYVLVIDPKVSWSNAPELPQEQLNVDNESQEVDEQVKQYRTLLKKQKLTQQDHDYQHRANNRVQQIISFRRQASRQSEFRNTVIQDIQGEIDPYAEEKSSEEIVGQVFEHLNRLVVEANEFLEWRKDKKVEPLIKSHQKEQHHLDWKTDQYKSSKPIDLLLEIVQRISNGVKQNQKHSELQKSKSQLISSFNFHQKLISKSTVKHVKQQNENKVNYIAENEQQLLQQKKRKLFLQRLKFPGLHRHMMPEVPHKSHQLRQYLRAEYVNFLPAGLTSKEFQRRMQLCNFEEYLCEVDQERNYELWNRTYAEQHDEQSLRRELSRCFEVDQYTLHTKYNELEDALYVAMLYMNNQRRIARKKYEGNWKVMPNYESWIKYFKNSENNLANTEYYDIDYEKIGNIEEAVSVYTVPAGASGVVVISKKCKVGNKVQPLLYCVEGDHTFGLNGQHFYSANEGTRIFHSALNSEIKSYETIIHYSDGKEIRLQSNGNLLTKADGQYRLVTPLGYSILYGSKYPVILHPNGAISHSEQNYTNEMGFGLKNGEIWNVSVFKKTTVEYQLIKRDDNTVIIDNQSHKQKWVKFFQGSQYLHNESGGIQIEKPNHPFVVCNEGSIRVQTKEFTIEIAPIDQDHYQHSIVYHNRHTVEINMGSIIVGRQEQKQKIEIDLEKRTISSQFGEQKIQITEKKSQLTRHNRILDPEQDEQKYGQQQILPVDHIQPRLFIIRNDNTGVELLNEQMLSQYFEISKADQLVQINRTKFQGKDVIHVLRRIDKQTQKIINNDSKLLLDGFVNETVQSNKPDEDVRKIRTLIVNQELSCKDLAAVKEIKASATSWKMVNIKQENQYGFKARNDPSTAQRITNKILRINYRKQPEQRIQTTKLTRSAIQIHLQKNRLAMQEQRKELREQQQKQLSLKPKESIAQQYKWDGVKKKKDETESFEEYAEPGDYRNYFNTVEGKKALATMPEWIFKPKIVEENSQNQKLINDLNSTAKKRVEEEQQSEQKQKYDTFEGERQPKIKQVIIKPSVFTQRDIDEERKAFEQEKKSYKYHEMKRKDYDLYGKQRRNRIEVPSLLRTQPVSEINQKYLIVQAPLDKRVKISSMKNKFTSEASSLVQMRKQGPHVALIKTLDKSNDINKLLQKRTMMVQADLNDKMQRDVLVNPVEANFGVVRDRGTYEFKIQVKNEDVISQRIALKRPGTIHVRVQMNEMGPIALGMTRKISVFLKASPDIVGKFTDSFDVVTKHEIYHIPITAQIVGDSQVRTEEIRLSKGVREVEESKKRGQDVQLPPIK